MKINYLGNWRSYTRIRNQAIKGMRFTDRREQLICGLFSRVDGLSQETIKLLKGGGSLGCPPLMRSALESYVDLKCLKQDENYVLEFDAMHVDNKIKYYKSYSEENPWFQHTNREEADRKVEELRALKRDLLGEKKKPMSLKERFALADESHAYDTTYHQLSNLVHSSIDAIANQFDGTNQVLNMPQKPAQTNFYYSVTINLCCATLMEVLEGLDHEKHLMSDLESVMKDVRKKSKGTVATD